MSSRSPPPLRELERGDHAPAARERGEHARPRRLQPPRLRGRRVDRRGPLEGERPHLGVAEARAPVVHLAGRRRHLALGAGEVAASRQHVGEPHARVEAHEVVQRPLHEAEVLAEQALGRGEVAAGEGEPRLVVHQPRAVVGTGEPPELRARPGERARRPRPVALAQRDVGEHAPRLVQVVRVVHPPRPGEPRQRQRARAGDVPRAERDERLVVGRRRHAGRVAGCHRDRGRALEVLGRRRQVAHDRREHAEGAVRVADRAGVVRRLAVEQRAPHHLAHLAVAAE
jgi:hypothetical protein